MHQNIAVILWQFNYGKYSFIALIPDRSRLDQLPRDLLWTEDRSRLCTAAGVCRLRQGDRPRRVREEVDQSRIKVCFRFLLRFPVRSVAAAHPGAVEGRLQL